MNFTYKQPYVTWKGPSTGSAVPAWSRPLINNNNGANTGTSFAARPIKHWRKQLVPAANSGISTNAGVGMPMDRPGGSVYLGATVDCSSCPVILAELIPTTKNTVFDSFTVAPSGECVACNPETNIIKSAVTLLNKNYYSDTKGYLQSRCQTYDQKLSTTPIPGNSYINSTTHEPIPPSDSPTGSQVYYTENCSKKCTTNNSRVTTIYKPNNQQYSQQGAVDSSSRLTRLKYNTITKNGNSFKTAWGQQGANAGRYQGTSDAPYFLKSKYQVCVPQHRDGNKTTSCIQPEEGCNTLTIINIEDIATLRGDEYTLNQNTTINTCEILTLNNNDILTIGNGKQLINKGIININDFSKFFCDTGSTIINQGVINVNINDVIGGSGGIDIFSIFINTGVINLSNLIHHSILNIQTTGVLNNSGGTINNSNIPYLAIYNGGIIYNPQNQLGCANGLITGTGIISPNIPLTTCAP
jgi:hypothetical protein